MEIIKIEGMGCANCTAAVKKALAAVEGIEVKEVVTGQATIEVKTGTNGLQLAIAAIEDAGYDVVQ